MNYHITLDQKKYSVNLKKVGSAWTLQVGKQRYTFSDLKQLGSTLWSLGFNKKEFIAASYVKENKIDLWLEDQRIEATVQPSYLDYRQQEASGEKQKLEIRSIMPGLIKKIHVQIGDTVKQGDPLFILEAMKMENEIESAHDGIVRKLYVHENQSVEGNALLIEIN